MEVGCEVSEVKPEITAVVTSYYEEDSIDEFHERLSAALKSTGRSHEIVMINDGSTDQTFGKMKGILDRDAAVSCILDFSKNSGQLAAWTAGVAESRGDVLLLIDSDLQFAPEELPKLLLEFDKGFDLVSGYREHRKDPALRKIASKLANVIMRKASQSSIRDFGGTFKLYNAQIVRAFEFGPFHIFNTADVVSRIQRYCEVPVSHYPRKYGDSGWTFRKLWQYNMDNIVRLSDRPFQIIGFACICVASLFALRVLFDHFFPFFILDEVTNGLLLNAVVIATLGLCGILCMIGELTIRTFVSARRIPRYIVREKIDRSA
jgi:glycosyltransferase involved in cell wall biosynthesis